MEYQFFKPPRETEFGKTKLDVPKIAGKNLTEANPRKTTGGFEKLRVEIIEIPLYMNCMFSLGKEQYCQYCSWQYYQS